VRVAYISPFPPEIHGVGDYTEALVEGLSKYLDDFIIISNVLQRQGKQERNRVFRVLNSRNPTSLLDAKRIIDRFSPDLVHVEWSIDLFWPWLPILLMALDESVLFTTHEVQIDRERLYADRSNWVRRLLEPIVKHLLLAYEKTMYRKACGIIVHDDVSRQRLLRNYGIDASKITLIRMGIRIPEIPKTDYTRKDVILFFGAIMPHKGLDVLLKAFESLCAKRRNVSLLIVGGEPTHFSKKKYLSDVKHEAAEIVGNIKFLGPVGQFEDIARLFRISDVIALPYREVSNSSVLANAQAYGVPIVATAVGGFMLHVMHEENGLLIEPNSVQELERALSRLLDDESLRRKIGVSARAYAERELSWNDKCRKTHRLYSALICSSTTRSKIETEPIT